MPRPKAFSQWRATIATHLPNLSKPQVTVLALWTWGLVCTRCASLTTVAVFLSLYFKCPLNTMRQRLREFYWEAKAKPGQPRRDLDGRTCFAPLLRWAIQGWPNRQLPLALDATPLGAKFVVLAISVGYRGCAVPVAWKILPATRSTPWKDEWLQLLKQFHGAVPRGWTVLVLTDRGLWAPWLFEALVALGWHPMTRINAGGNFRPDGQAQFLPLKSFAPKEEMRWRGQGTAFSTPSRQLRATLLAWWGSGHEQPWLILTDLAPAAGEADWYGLRTWTEQGFKDCKRGGWQWQHTRMSAPARAERLWLAIAVATLWLLRVGGEAEQKGGCQKAVGSEELDLLKSLGAEGATRATKQRRTKRWRLVSVFALGWLTILSALLNHESLPRGRWYPEPWPEAPQ